MDADALIIGAPFEAAQYLVPLEAHVRNLGAAPYLYGSGGVTGRRYVG
jgi:hypothetical protein